MELYNNTALEHKANDETGLCQQTYRKQNYRREKCEIGQTQLVGGINQIEMFCKLRTWKRKYKKNKKKKNVNFGNDFGKCQICKFIQHITIKTYFTEHGQQENI